MASAQQPMEEQEEVLTQQQQEAAVQEARVQLELERQRTEDTKLQTQEAEYLRSLQGIQGLEGRMRLQNVAMNELNRKKTVFRQNRPGLRSMPTAGTFAAPALIFPYHKRHGRSAKEVKFFKLGKIWGIIVGSTSIDAATELR